MSELHFQIQKSVPMTASYFEMCAVDIIGHSDAVITESVLKWHSLLASGRVYLWGKYLKWGIMMVFKN